MGHYYNPPPPRMGGAQPHTPRKLAAGLLAAAVVATDLSGAYIPRVVQVAPPAPQQKRMPNPAIYEAVAAPEEFIPNSRRHAWQSWAIADPLPQLGRKLNPSLIAVQEDTLGKRPEVPVAVHIAWIPPPPLPTLNEKLPPSVADVAVNDPSGHLGVLRIVRLAESPVPRKRRQLDPALLDNPPAPFVPFKRHPVWWWSEGYSIIAGAIGPPDSVDDPPFAAHRVSLVVVPLAWRPPAPLPTLRPKLPPSDAAVAVDHVSVQPGRYLATDLWWRVPPPQPTQARKLPPSVVDVAVNDPSGSAPFRVVTVAKAHPQLQRRFNPAVFAVADADTVLRPFRLEAVYQAWRAPDPQPTQARKLPVTVTAVAEDTVLFRRPVQPYFAAPDPLPQRKNSLSPGIPGQSVDDPPGLQARVFVQVAPYAPVQVGPKYVHAAAPDTAQPYRVILDQWRVEYVRPQTARPLNPSITAVAVDDPPFNSRDWRPGVLVAWRLPDPLPLRPTIKVTQGFTPAAPDTDIHAIPFFATPGRLTVR